MSYELSIRMVISFYSLEDMQSFKADLLINNEELLQFINDTFEHREENVLYFSDDSLRSSLFSRDHNALEEIWKYLNTNDLDVDAYYGTIGEDLADMSEDTINDGWKLLSIYRGFTDEG